MIIEKPRSLSKAGLFYFVLEKYVHIIVQHVNDNFIRF